MRHRLFAFLLLCAFAPADAGADEDLAARVDASVRQAGAAGGTFFHLSDPIAALGKPAVPHLAALAADPGRTEKDRVLAVQALGRIRAPEALEALLALLDRRDLPEDVRANAEESCYLQGRTEAVDERVARLAVRHRDVPIAAAGATWNLARLYAATGRFRVAASLMRDLVSRTRAAKPSAASFHAYDWACYEALAGDRDAALRAVRIALESEGVDLEWMAKDGDLALLRDDETFRALLAEARGRRPADAPGEGWKQEPGAAEYEALRDDYRNNGFMPFIEANNRYWGGYEAWLAEKGLEPGPEAARAYEEKMGPEPVDRREEWEPKFRALFEKHRGTGVGRQARTSLLVMFSNAEKTAEFVDLFVDGLKTDTRLDGLSDQADTALYFAEKESRLEEVRDAIAKAMAAHPDDAGCPGFALALAQLLAGDGASEAAKAAYADVVRRYPGTPAAKEAEGAIYELTALATGASAPEAASADIRGASWSLAAQRGKVVLLDFWATWCGPCVGEIPSLKALHEKHGGDDRFAMVGISLDEDGWALAEFLESRGIGWRQICDLRGFDGPLARLYNVRGIPRTVLIDRRGRIAHLDLRGKDVEEAVAKLLASEE